jgi:hypothetical protein
VGRFAPDGVTVLYTDSRSRKSGLASTRIDTPHTIPLGVENAAVKSISPQGEVALLLRPRIQNQIGAAAGTLARMPITGGPPREWLENVDQADYLPDGSMAVLRHTPGNPAWTVEWPVGHTVYTSNTFLGEMRASPDGKLLAFCDQQIFPDDRGFIGVLDQKGSYRRLTREFGSLQGLAWSPQGDEIWFGAADEWDTALHAVTLDGRERLLARAPAQLRLLDVDSRGRALVRASIKENGVRCQAPGAAAEVECAAGLDAYVRGLTPDGAWIISLNQAFEPPNYGVYFGKTDGSPAVRLGDGLPEAVSPDGKWVVVNTLAGGEEHYKLYPTRAGEPRDLSFDPSLRVIGIVFFPDGKRMAVNTVDKKQGVRRSFVRDEDGTMHPIEGAATPVIAITPDSRFFILDEQPGKQEHGPTPESVGLLPVGGGKARLLTIAPDDHWGLAGAGAESLLVSEWAQPGDGTVRVERVALDTGKRTTVREIHPPLAGGFVFGVQASGDARAWAYVYGRITTKLYVLEGLR